MNPATIGAATDARQGQLDYALTDVEHLFPGTERPAIESVSLEIERGETIALIGPSGCGKSTILNMLAGLLVPTGGRVELRGRQLTHPSPVVGLMFQKAALLPWRTALENILLPIEIRSGKRLAQQNLERALRLLETVGLAGYAHAYPWQLSGGMAQRAAICRMLISDPEILLLDEPFGALDELTRERMDFEVQRVATERGASVVLVTHSIPEAVLLADRVVAMAARPGRIIDTIPIELERPRSYESMRDPRFAEGVARVREALDRGHRD